MNKIYIQNLFIMLALLFSCFSYAQNKATNDPKTFQQELFDVTIAHTEAEINKKISTELARAAMNESNRALVSKTTSELMKSVKHMTKQQTTVFLSKLSKMSSKNLSKLAQLSPRGLNSFAASAVSKLSKNSKSLTTIIGAAGDKAGNAALQAVSKIDEVVANGGKVSKEMIKKLKDAADNLPPGRVRAFLDYLKNKSVTEWKDITDLETPDKGPGSVVGTVIDGVFVLYDFYDIYYSDDEPEIKEINYTTKGAGYAAGTIGSFAASEAAGAAATTAAASFGAGLLIAWSATQVANVTNEYLMLQKELEDKKDAQTFERANNRVLVMRQFIKVNNKIKAGQISNANSLLIKLEQFLASNNCENEEKLFDLHKGLEEMAKTAARKELINNIINKAKKPYLKALNLYNKRIQLHIAKINAAEALAILNKNLKKYPEIGTLEAIPASKTLINNINEKIANAGALVITNVNVPKQVSPGEDIEIPVYVKGGIPYYSGIGSIYGNTSDKTEVTFNWTAPTKPGIEKFILKLQDCMGSIASTSVSIDVVEEIEDIIPEKISEEELPGKEIMQNKEEGVIPKFTFVGVYIHYSGTGSFKKNGVVLHEDIYDNKSLEVYFENKNYQINGNRIVLKDYQELGQSGIDKRTEQIELELVFKDLKNLKSIKGFSAKKTVIRDGYNKSEKYNSAKCENVPFEIVGFNSREIFLRYEGDISNYLSDFKHTWKLQNHKEKYYTSGELDKLNKQGRIDISIYYE